MTPSADRTSDLLADIANGDDSTPPLDMDALLGHFRRRAFGILLLLVLLPVFLPVPFGVGALCGPLVSLLGLQLMLNRRWPWLPGWLRRRPVSRQSLQRFLKKGGRWLKRVEQLSRPRLDWLFTHPASTVVTGLLLILLGLLLALPIPLTNYPFGLLILLYALALLERDGVLLLIAWAAGSATLIGFAGVASEALGWLHGFIA
ncbi:MAG: exopolysaccharide biosynthesis protein [Lysobacteraceae bacterium]